MAWASIQLEIFTVFGDAILRDGIEWQTSEGNLVIKRLEDPWCFRNRMRTIA
jgi:hypothetical protein